MTSSSSSSLERLPREVGHMIVAHLGPSDVKSLRLTSRRLAAYGDDELFGHLDVYLTEESLGRLLRVSQHPWYASRVRKITCWARLVTQLDRDDFDILALTAFVDRMSMSDRMAMLRLEHSTKDIKDIVKKWHIPYSNHQRLAMVEDKLLRQTWAGLPFSTYQDRLTSAMRNFKGLTCVRHDFPGVDSSPLTPYAKWVEGQTMLNYLSKSYGTKLEGEQLYQIICAVGISGAPVTKLLASSGEHNGTVIDPSLWSAMDPGLWRRGSMTMALERLTHLSLRARWRISPLFPLPVNEDRDCRAFFRATKNLTHLIFTAEDVAWVQPGHFCLDGIYFPRLTSLLLTRVVATESNFHPWLKAHIGTLRHLHLRHINLEKGHWRKILQTLRAYKRRDAANFIMLYSITQRPLRLLSVYEYAYLGSWISGKAKWNELMEMNWGTSFTLPNIIDPDAESDSDSEMDNDPESDFESDPESVESIAESDYESDPENMEPDFTFETQSEPA
ncbi:MAG: hypothetical protein M1825_003874 [Sarcosagium campestre]|nr:MAG: hypothetical protein M1825_003874 [Sarcosagium campestre]